MNCTKCGEKIREGVYFCGKCGNELFNIKQDEISKKVVIYGFKFASIYLMALIIISLFKPNFPILISMILNAIFVLSFFVPLLTLLLSNRDEKRTGQKIMLFSAIFTVIGFACGMLMVLIKDLIAGVIYEVLMAVFVCVLILAFILLVIGGIGELIYKAKKQG